MTDSRLPEETHSGSRERRPEVDQPAPGLHSAEETEQSGWQLESDADDTSDGDWPAEDLESAYRRALEANSAIEWEFAGSSDNPELDGVSDGNGIDSASEPHDSDRTEDWACDVTELPGEASERVTARQVIEAALFVGGDSLTTKRLCFMLRGDYDLDYIEDVIGNLNQQYEQEARPYEIRLGEGGYRLVLHDEFQRVRNRVFGVGPREIRLSQSVLEVLALVAYRQPVSRKSIEEQISSSCGPLLRQLLRRELIAIQRDDRNRKKVEYVTTKRFLSVFGLGRISELPQADELGFR